MWVRRLSTLILFAALSVAVSSAAQVPRQSPEFAINTMDGKQILLSQYKGKVVALIFILTTCPHCQHTVGILTKLQNEYGPRGFQVLATAIEDMAKMDVPGFIQQFQPSFPVGYNYRDSVLEYLQHPAMFRLLMPQLVFIDRRGVIRAQYSGDDQFFAGDQEKNIGEMIEKLLKEGASAAHKPAGRTSRAKR